MWPMGKWQIANILEIPNRIAKRTEILDSVVRVEQIRGTFVLVVFMVIWSQLLLTQCFFLKHNIQTAASIYSTLMIHL